LSKSQTLTEEQLRQDPETLRADIFREELAARSTDEVVETLANIGTFIRRKLDELSPIQKDYVIVESVLLERLEAANANVLPHPLFDIRRTRKEPEKEKNIELARELLPAIRIGDEPIPAEELAKVIYPEEPKPPEWKLNLTHFKTLIKKYGSAAQEVYDKVVTLGNPGPWRLEVTLKEQKNSNVSRNESIAGS